MKKVFFISVIFLSFALNAANPIKLVVKDENNEPIIGAVIESVVEDNALFTDFVGEATINPQKEAVVYKIESIGYETVYVRLSEDLHQDAVKVVLKPRGL